MASRYAEKFSIPEGFPQILREFTKEVLRENPQNIYDFGHQYFNGLASQNGEKGPGDLSPEELRDLINRLFQEADKDGNGYLDRKEFKSVFVGLQSDLKLSAKEIRQIMSEADENQDGRIDYGEFVPLFIDVYYAMIAKREHANETAALKETALENARNFLLKGMPREELELLLHDVFEKADVDKGGYLSRSEFVKCMKDSNLGFTRKEVNVMMSEVDENKDGKITYNEFAPMCFSVLTEMVALRTMDTPQDQSEMARFFIDLFMNAAGNGQTHLKQREVVELLKAADLGLTFIQIHSILSEVSEDGSGKVNIEECAKVASAMINNLFNMEASIGSLGNIKSIREMDDYNLVNGLDPQTFTGTLSAALYAADSKQSGYLHRNVIFEHISAALPTIQPQQMQAMLSLALSEDDGFAAYQPIIEKSFQVLQYMQEQELLKRF